MKRYVCKTHGYVMELWNGEHPLFPGVRAVRQHRRIIAEELGRELQASEHIHHRNQNKADNSRQNLVLMKAAEHVKEHNEGRKHSLETRTKISLSAKLISNTPAQRKQRTFRAREQHKNKNFGAHTWTEETRKKFRERYWEDEDCLKLYREKQITELSNQALAEKHGVVSSTIFKYLQRAEKLLRIERDLLLPGERRWRKSDVR